MKSLIKSSFIFTALTAVAVAAPADPNHVPSIKDLIYPTINFVLYAGGAIYLLKPILKNMFDKKAADIVSLMNSAEARSKDAKAKLATYETKMKNLDSEVSKINSDYSSDVQVFAQNASDETKKAIATAVKYTASKIEGEEKSLTEELNTALIASVIEKTKQTINANAALKASATKNIVSELR